MIRKIAAELAEFARNNLAKDEVINVAIEACDASGRSDARLLLVTPVPDNEGGFGLGLIQVSPREELRRTITPLVESAFLPVGIMVFSEPSAHRLAGWDYFIPPSFVPGPVRKSFEAFALLHLETVARRLDPDNQLPHLGEIVPFPPAGGNA